MFGHDNGVIDDDADGEDECEQGDGVDREIEHQHDCEGANPRNGKAGGHPQREADLKEQGQRDDDEQ